MHYGAWVTRVYPGFTSDRILHEYTRPDRESIDKKGDKEEKKED